MTAHVPIPLADQVDLLAIRLERSRGWIVKQALSIFVEQEEHRYRLTLEGLADVDAGRTVDHAAVEAWAASLDSDTPLPLPECK
jgi:predicted transcriptional regulator